MKSLSLIQDILAFPVIIAISVCCWMLFSLPRVKAFFYDIKINTLAWLLFHANKLSTDRIYKVKKAVLTKYGRLICYDIQFIEGKKCRTCGGTGVFSKYYDNYGCVSDINYCWNCHNGWYKRPVWNFLERIKLGKYEFHTPFQQIHFEPHAKVTIHGC